MADLLTRRAAAIAAVAVTGLLTGCAGRDSITVGAVPDDYRTNHPIVLTEKEQVLDLPVGTMSHHLTRQQKAAIEGFLDRYRDDGRAVVTILAPEGSPNAPAAASLSRDITAFLERRGVPHIQTLSYRASVDEVPPIRISYTILGAAVAPCGRWPEDILANPDNRHYANFGCSYQNNLAAQVANPMDFLGPRKMTPIDAENRMGVIDKYRGLDSDYDAGKLSRDFANNSEVDY